MQRLYSFVRDLGLVAIVVLVLSIPKPHTQPAAAADSAALTALPDIPACGKSDRPDLVAGYLVCSINWLYAENTDLEKRLADVETIRRTSAYAERLWSYMGDRGEYDERRRLTFQDPRRQQQTRYQVELALCRNGVPTTPRLACPPVNPLAP